MSIHLNDENVRYVEHAMSLYSLITVVNIRLYLCVLQFYQCQVLFSNFVVLC